MTSDIYKFSLYCSKIFKASNPNTIVVPFQNKSKISLGPLQSSRDFRSELKWNDCNVESDSYARPQEYKEKNSHEKLIYDMPNGSIIFARLITAFYYAVNFINKTDKADKLNKLDIDSLSEGLKITDRFLPQPDSMDTTAFELAVQNLLELDIRQFVRNPGIIGWMYMYFNETKKADAYTDLRNNIKISGSAVAPATQIFTPAWITRYLTENAIFRLSGTAGISSSNEYYHNNQDKGYFIPDLMDNPGLEVADPIGITLLDPCMGCGHMLLGAFDAFMNVYKALGIDQDIAAAKIITQNLYGLDVDKLAVYLGRFTILMKAAEYNHQLIESPPEMNMYSISHAELGSLIEVNLKGDADIGFTVSGLPNKDARVGAILAGSYDIVATNPPYMGHHNMSGVLSAYVKKRYPLSKTDLSTVFMERAFELCKPSGIIAMINIQAWLYLPSYEKFREYLINNKTLLNMLDLGRGAFGVGLTNTVAFCMLNSPLAGYMSTFVNLSDTNGAFKKEFFISSENRYFRDTRSFLKIPQSIFAYSLDEPTLRIMTGTKRLREYGTPKQGLKTGDNKRFIRLWHEVPREDICFDAKNRAEAALSGKKWFPYNKAGECRKWYGNNRYVVNWENDGAEIRALRHSDGRPRSRAQNMDYFFRSCVSWNMISHTMSARLIPDGLIFDGAGGSIFTDHRDYILGYLNSGVAEKFLRETSRSINFNVGQIADLPLIISETRYAEIISIVKECVEIAKWEWDLTEASWDFFEHPLTRANYYINTRGNLRDIALAFMQDYEKRTLKLLDNECRLNLIFADIYGFAPPSNSDCKTEIPYKIDIAEIVKGLISYGVGCIFGRFHNEKFDAINKCAHTYADASKLFVSFLSNVFGTINLTENIMFVSSVLGNAIDSGHEAVINRYFHKEFLKNHRKAYLSRPIYVPYGQGMSYTDMR